MRMRNNQLQRFVMMERREPVAVLNRELKLEEVVDYFGKCNGKSKYPCMKPKGGQIFMYCYDGEMFKNDWRADGYRWSQNGIKLIPKQLPQIRKIYFVTQLPEGIDHRFKRHAYFLIGKENAGLSVLVHYLGNESVAVDYQHGNSKAGTNFFRTVPSVLTQMANSTDLPGNIYKSSIARNDCLPENVPLIKPRNAKQIQNLQHRERQNSRLTQDALYNLHEIAYDLGDFVIAMRTFPDLVVICGIRTLVNELNQVLLVDSEQPQLLSYDTTFQLGDFYLSPLLFRHTLFRPSPVIPALFLIHERKFQSCHKEFMEKVSTLVPNLVNGKTVVPLVTDDEVAIHQAINQYLPNVTRLQCWNHKINAVKHWLRKHGATSSEIPVYVAHVRDLLNQPSLRSYEEKLQECKEKWSHPFLLYYMETCHSEIGQNLGRFVLEPLNLYQPFTGVTNNQSESFNAIIKRLQRWREVPVDSIVLTLYHIQAYFHNEVQRGFAGLGNYRLLPRFLNTQKSLDELHLISSYSPEEIVERVTSTKGSDCVQKETEGKRDDVPGHAQTEESICMTQQARARMVVTSGHVHLNQSMGVFTVLGTGGKAHAVRIFPSESCTCPATGKCYHIRAAQMSVGMEDSTNGKKKVNLTQLRKNTRSRGDKKSGRKAPRPGDCDIIPAPDSSASIKLKSIDHLSLPLPTNKPLDSVQQNTNISQVDLFSESSQVNISNERNEQGVMEERSDNAIIEAATQEIGEVLPGPTSTSIITQTNGNEHKKRIKRKRCGTCTGCISKDCGKCRFCLDKIKFGGLGKLKQCCEVRACKKLKLETKSEANVEQIFKQDTSPSRKDEITSVLSKHDDFKVCCNDSISIYVKDLKTLIGSSWLNDKIVDFYLSLLTEEANKRKNKKVLCLSSFFFKKLEGSEMSTVSSWVANDALSYQKILIPVCHHNHWVLVVLNSQKHQIHLYDSLQLKDFTILQLILNFFATKFPSVVSEKWKKEIKKNIPLQHNGCDCGVFLCMYAYHEVFELKKFNFDQADIPSRRGKILAEIISKNLLIVP